MILRILLRKKGRNHVFSRKLLQCLLGHGHFSDRNSNKSPHMGLLQSDSAIFSIYNIYAMWLIMFNKMAELCVTFLDDRLFFVFLL